MNIIIRTDAAQQIGIGHVMRCLTLADELHKDGAQIRFVCKAHRGHLQQKIVERGYPVTLLNLEQGQEKEDDPRGYSHWLGGDWCSDADSTIGAIGAEKIDWLIVDHYAIDRSWHQRLREHADKLMVIDDLADRPMDCDLLLDQTYGRKAVEWRVHVPQSCSLLLGAKYALLHPEFARLRAKAVERRNQNVNIMPQRLFISMGGFDSLNVTGRVLDAVTQSVVALGLQQNFAIDIVVGSQISTLTEVRRQAEAVPFPVYLHVDSDRIPRLMLEADVAVGAAGATTWERCILGLPSFVVELADNQREILRRLTDAHAIVNMGRVNESVQTTWVAKISEVLAKPQLLHEISENALNICDGLGVRRVGLHFDPSYAADGRQIRLRMIEIEDAHIILTWQKAEPTRRYAKNTQIPEWEEHVQWMQCKLSDYHCFMRIIMHGNDPAGVLRLDYTDRFTVGPGYLVSIFIAPEKYRLGLARAALIIAQRLFADDVHIAQIHNNNIASLALFKRSGYVCEARSGLYIWKP
ncbi:MAG: UDP-2,4-diacetamido-2,4,6-trideoxy-beta-L-altropyranose hydrolase [Rhodospirillaceae bacterium]|jgi:UDP-2,4-diacetamido-2,4,6-trideoxy-beta-L-altropyranose hydrolase|nr:UDP-2,4-diacetamido-2,4,6-trideoxy-beta-L-altropyranose hydrolase [Rhodospirillaceae bacterium]